MLNYLSWLPILFNIYFVINFFTVSELPAFCQRKKYISCSTSKFCPLLISLVFIENVLVSFIVLQRLFYTHSVEFHIVAVFMDLPLVFIILQCKEKRETTCKGNSSSSKNSSSPWNIWILGLRIMLNSHRRTGISISLRDLSFCRQWFYIVVLGFVIYFSAFFLHVTFFSVPDNHPCLPLYLVHKFSLIIDNVWG